MLSLETAETFMVILRIGRMETTWNVLFVECVVSFFVEAGDESRRERCRKRHQRIRNRVKGTAERPRLAVYRSNNHIYCQVIDDVAQRTLAAANTLQATIKEKIEHGGNIDAAAAVGAAVAEACKGANVTKVVFDRGGNLYHGRVKALADAAREGGLEF